VEHLGFVHRFVPPRDITMSQTLLLLHGTGGDESDLIPLGAVLAPGAALLSPPGKVSEHGAPRYFRRLAEGVFDVDDLRFRTHELADFVGTAASAYGFDPARVIAVGFSNGANIAASLLLRPGLLSAAVLFHSMVPRVPERAPDLSATAMFVGAGRLDPLVPTAETERLVDLLQRAGADVTVNWTLGGHGLSPEEVRAAARWLQQWRG
jgi:predicted esterase